MSTRKKSSVYATEQEPSKNSMRRNDILVITIENICLNIQRY